MYISEWNVGGVYFTPMLEYFLIALILYYLVLKILRFIGVSGWVWYEALFNLSVFTCIWAVVTGVMTAHPIL